MNQEQDDNPQRSQSRFWPTRSGMALGVLGAIAGWLLVNEHQAHLLQTLPFLLVGGCIVMHLFMHSRHGDHAGHSGNEKSQSEMPEDQPRPAQVSDEVSGSFETRRDG